MIVKQPKPSVYKKNAFSHKAMCITILRPRPSVPSAPKAQMFFVEPFAIKEVYCNKNIQIHSRWRHTGGHEMLYLYRFIQEVRQNISTLHFWATEHRYVSYFSFFRNVCEILLSTLEVI